MIGTPQTDTRGPRTLGTHVLIELFFFIWKKERATKSKAAKKQILEILYVGVACVCSACDTNKLLLLVL